MKTTMGLAYLLLLLGSAAAFGDRKMERSEIACKSYFSPTFFTDDEGIESCLSKPGIAAAVDGYTGTEVDKKIEITLQCELKLGGMFTDGVLDADKLKLFFEGEAQKQSYGASITQGLDACFSMIQKPIQILPIMRCFGEYC